MLTNLITTLTQNITKVRKDYLRQRKLEELRLKQKEESLNNKKFREDPDKFASNLLSPPKQGDPSFNEVEANTFFCKHLLRY